MKKTPSSAMGSAPHQLPTQTHADLACVTHEQDLRAFAMLGCSRIVRILAAKLPTKKPGGRIHRAKTPVSNPEF
jgi:hypothetical protein